MSASICFTTLAEVNHHFCEKRVGITRDSKEKAKCQDNKNSLS